MVIQEGFEPPTHGLEGRCSIQLGYWTIRRLRRVAAFCCTTYCTILFEVDSVHGKFSHEISSQTDKVL